MPAPDSHFTSGRPTSMGFLSDMIHRVDLEWPNENLSPFIESIIVATLCGRTLEHQQRRSVSLPQHHLMLHHPDRHRDSAYDFCRQHRSLSGLLIQHMKMLQVQLSSPMENPDPIYIFVALAVCMAIFMLYETIESNPLGTETQATKAVDALLVEHKQHSLDAAYELGVLITALGQLNHFQVGGSLYASPSLYTKRKRASPNRY